MNTKGQAYVETLLVMPIFVFFLVSITFLARVFIATIILNQAARHGVFLIVYANYNENDVKEEIVDYLRNEKHLLPDIKKEDISVYLGLGWQFKAAEVKIKYEIKLPKLLYRIPGFPKPFYVSCRSACFNDTWYFGFPSNMSHS